MAKITKASLAAIAEKYPELLLSKEEQRQIIGGNKAYGCCDLPRTFEDTDHTMTLPMGGAYPTTHDHHPTHYDRGNTPFKCSTDDPPPNSGAIIPPQYPVDNGKSGAIGSGAHYHYATDGEPGDYEYGRELDPANIIGSKYDSDASGAYIGSYGSSHRCICRWPYGYSLYSCLFYCRPVWWSRQSHR